jgi:hypothetical protein
LIWDGGFENDIAGGFSWHLDAPTGSVIRYSMRVKQSGRRAVEIEFDGRRNVNFRGVCQFVMVQPETDYDFSAWLRTDKITTDRGVFLRLSSPENTQPETAGSELTETHPWTQTRIRWHSSQQAHVLQICLARATSSMVYNRIAGTVWIDDVQLVPVRSAEKK